MTWHRAVAACAAYAVTESVFWAVLTSTALATIDASTGGDGMLDRAQKSHLSSGSFFASRVTHSVRLSFALAVAWIVASAAVLVTLRLTTLLSWPTRALFASIGVTQCVLDVYLVLLVATPIFRVAALLQPNHGMQESGAHILSRYKRSTISWEYKLCGEVYTDVGCYSLPRRVAATLGTRALFITALISCRFIVLWIANVAASGVVLATLFSCR